MLILIIAQLDITLDQFCFCFFFFLFFVYTSACNLVSTALMCGCCKG